MKKVVHKITWIAAMYIIECRRSSMRSYPNVNNYNVIDFWKRVTCKRCLKRRKK